MRIGIDFDNTLAVHDRGLAAAAAERGLVAGGFGRGRRALFDLVRALPDGDAEWRRLEGRAFGPLMDLAELAPGAAGFLVRCRDRGVEVVVLVRRPAAAPFDPARADLHAAARDWMERRRFFAADGFAIPRGHVHFVDSRRAKLDRIAALGLAGFVDTADEAFREPFFPAGVTRWLLGDGGWEEIAAAVLG